MSDLEIPDENAWRRVERVVPAFACVECGRQDDGGRGWKLRRDDGLELRAICNECDERQLGRD